MVKSSNTSNEPNIAPFLSKCYEMVDDPSTNGVISWSQANDSFVIWNMTEFSRDLLPKFFKHQNFSSFMRQLNIYGFRKVDTDRWEFANEGFIKDQKHLLKHIKRRKHPQGVSQKTPPLQEQVIRVSHEVDYSRLQREVETLKTDKSALMQELDKLRERLDSSQNRLLVLRERVQGMENSQQQLLSFLVMVMQNPGLLVQLLRNWRVAESGKITLNEEMEYENGAIQDGMIVPYHPQLQPDDNDNPSPSPAPSPLSEADFPETTFEHDFSFDKVKDFFMHFDFPSSPSPLDESFLSTEPCGSIIVPELDLAMIEQFLLSSPIREKPDEAELDDHDEESADMEVEIEAALCDSDAQLQEISQPKSPSVQVEGNGKSPNLPSLELVTEQMGFLSPGNGS